jgi:carbonic anhydrase
LSSTRAAACSPSKTPGPDAAAELKSTHLDFLPFPDLEQTVEDDVKYLKASMLVPDSVAITGWIYEVETGKTRQVV